MKPTQEGWGFKQNEDIGLFKLSLENFEHLEFKYFVAIILLENDQKTFQEIYVDNHIHIHFFFFEEGMLLENGGG